MPDGLPSPLNHACLLDTSSEPHLKILVVDGGVSTADMLALFFKLEGHEVQTAYSGPSGLEAAEQMRPDLVFLDISMPGMDGYETARLLRQSPLGGGPVLVALTGWDRQGDSEVSRDAGFDHHLVKPVEPATLRHLLSTLSGRADEV